MAWQAADGPRSLPVRERGYVPGELRLLCAAAGFDVEHLWGGTAGAWGAGPSSSTRWRSWS